MTVCRLHLVLFASLCLSAACIDGGGEGGLGDSPDSGFASSADATPATPDAAPPQADAAPQDDPGLGGNFPVELACSLDDLQPVVTCVSDNCIDAFADGTLLTCVTINCGLLLLTLPPECSQCLLTGLTDTSMALDACVLGLDDLGGGFPIPPAP